MTQEPRSDNNDPGWCLVRTAETRTGARKAARGLSDTAVQEGRLVNPGFFASMAELLLWPLLYTAAVTNRSMVDVVGWVLTQDRPKGDEDGEVAGLVTAELGCGDALRQAWAAEAVTDLALIWDHDERVRDSVYAVAETLVRPWQ